MPRGLCLSPARRADPVPPGKDFKGLLPLLHMGPSLWHSLRDTEAEAAGDVWGGGQHGPRGRGGLPSLVPETPQHCPCVAAGGVPCGVSEEAEGT